MTAAIIQARLTSKRFPNKIMEKLGDKTVLQHVIDNVRQAEPIKKIIVASPHPLKFEGAESFIGQEDDVLDRYYRCANEFKIDTIVRITSDCPLLKSNWIDFAVDLFRKNPEPYIIIAPVSGLDVEVFSYRLLQEAWGSTTEPSDREHVTPYMKRVTNISVDTKEDLEKVRKIYADSNPSS